MSFAKRNSKPSINVFRLQGFKLYSLIELKRQLINGELCKGTNLGIAYQNHKPKKLAFGELSFSKGEKIGITDSNKYPQWSGKLQSGKKGSVNAKMIKMIAREQWTMQDMVDFGLDKFDIEGINKSSSEGITVVFTGRHSHFVGVINALEERYIDSPEMFFWLDILSAPAKLANTDSETSKIYWVQTFPKSCAEDISNAVIYLDAAIQRPSVFSVVNSWALYQCIRNSKSVTILMTNSNTTELHNTMPAKFDSIFHWISRFRLKDSENKTSFDTCLLESGEILKADLAIQHFLKKWLLERGKVSVERIRLRLPSSMEDALIDDKMKVMALQGSGLEEQLGLLSLEVDSKVSAKEYFASAK